MNLSGNATILGYTLKGLSIFFILYAIALRAVHLMALFWSRWKYHRKQPYPEDIALPGISIIKPLVGVDPNLPSNLESFFTQHYPPNKFELLFCVGENFDPAIPVVLALIKKHPHINARLFVGGEEVGVNPKINNMQPAYASANPAFEIVMISDSGLRMKVDTLVDMVAHMDEKTGLVHQMPFTCDRPSYGFPATLEKVYFGTGHARIYLSSDMLGINCCTGMSVLMRKRILDDVGGIKAFGCYLAEDYFFTKYIMGKGWKTSISGQPAWQNSGNCTVEAFLARTSRWAKLRFAMVPTTIFWEPISECLLIGILIACGTNCLFSWNPLTVFLCHSLVWFIMDYLLLVSVQNGSLPFSKLEFLLTWLYREGTAFFYFLKSLLFPNIKWRQGYYRLKWGGKVEKVVCIQNQKV